VVFGNLLKNGGYHMIKICSRCKLEKNENEFHKDKNRKDGLYPHCKICKNLATSAHGKINREKNKIKLQIWRAKNKEKCKEYSIRDREKNYEKIVSRRKTPEARKKMRLAIARWREKNFDQYREKANENRRKNINRCKARLALMNEIRRGRIIRPPQCEICMKDCKPDGHHKDYSKPLEVQWLCKLCHFHEHGKLLDLKGNYGQIDPQG
jgi:hypothetical protein